MTPATPPQPPTPQEQRAIRRHLHSAEGAHLLCRRKACRRARACRLDGTCASRLYGAAGPLPADEELMSLHIAYLLTLVAHWERLPRRSAPPSAGRSLRRRDG